MARQVDGVWLPERVSGHPALELNNTVGGWGYAQPREYLADYRTLAVLGHDLGLLDPDERAAVLDAAAAEPATAQRALRDVKRLRAAAHEIIVGDDASGDAADQLHRLVAAAAGALRYRRDGTGRLRLDGGTGVRLPLHRFALSAHELLSSHPRRAIRPCADTACGWVFLDPSGRRRWCEMSVCGNRAKARRYARRHRSPAS